MSWTFKIERQDIAIDKRRVEISRQSDANVHIIINTSNYQVIYMRQSLQFKRIVHLCLSLGSAITIISRFSNDRYWYVSFSSLKLEKDATRNEPFASARCSPSGKLFVGAVSEGGISELAGV